MSYRICLLPGDGIGREVIDAAREVLEALSLDAIYDERPIGWECFRREGTALPASTLAAVREADAALLGAVGSPSQRVAGYRSPVVALRRELDLYACVRPVRTPPLPNARPDVDLVVVRENSEGLYAGLEERSGDRAVVQRVITASGSARIVRWALRYTRQHERRRITIVHKANVLRETCGLFRETALNVLADAGEIAVDELLVDTAAYHMVRDPERFDVIVTTNLFGDILSDAASAWGGGLGLAASANLGDHGAIFEPVHGSAPDIAGRGIANPLAAIRAAALMLDHLGESDLDRRVQSAIDATLRAGIWTPDLGGSATTADVTKFVISQLHNEE
ncbi:MAG TPA: isocitrate/isopropylmalate dehydrogenase family protein [Herpetosiphonaceae bacterium]